MLFCAWTNVFMKNNWRNKIWWSWSLYWLNHQSSQQKQEAINFNCREGYLTTVWYRLIEVLRNLNLKTWTKRHIIKWTNEVSPFVWTYYLKFFLNPFKRTKTLPIKLNYVRQSFSKLKLLLGKTYNKMITSSQIMYVSFWTTWMKLRLVKLV